MMTAAAAHQIDDEPIDPAEAEMPAVDFTIFGRAHELCDHPPAVDLAAEKEQDEEGHQCPSMTTEQAALEQRESQNCESPTLTRIALKILRSQIRAVALVREMKARGEPPLFQIIEKTLS
jgi:hypothetical protein